MSKMKMLLNPIAIVGIVGAVAIVGGLINSASTINLPNLPNLPDWKQFDSENGIIANTYLLLTSNYAWIGFLLVAVGWWIGKTWLQGIGALILLLAIITSGFGQYFGKSVSDASLALSCAAERPDEMSKEKKLDCNQLETRQRLAREAALAVEIAEAEHQATLRAARNYVPPPPEPVRVTGQPCSTERGLFKGLTADNECEVVTFGEYQKYHFEGRDDYYCPRAYPGDDGEWVDLAGNQWDFVPSKAGSTQTFYYQAPNTTFLDSYCPPKPVP